MEPLRVKRPAPIPLRLQRGTVALNGLLTVQRPPLKGGNDWAWRLVWREDGRQKQRGLGRSTPEDAFLRASRAWEDETRDVGGCCTRRGADDGCTAGASTHVAAPADLTKTGQAVAQGPPIQRPTLVPLPPNPRRCGPPDGVECTVALLIHDFLAWHDGRPARVRRCTRTLHEYRYRLDTLAALIGPVLLSDLNEDLFDQCVETLLAPDFRATREAHFDANRAPQQTRGPRARGRGYARSTVNQVLQIASMLLRWGRKRGWAIPPVDPNAARLRGVTAPEERVNRWHTPEDDEVRDLLAALRPSATRRAIWICWQTGARRGELQGLRWRDLVQRPTGCFVDLGADPTAEGSRKNRGQPVRSVAVSPAVFAQLCAERPPDAKDDDRVAPGTDWDRRMITAQERRGIPEGRQFTDAAIFALQAGRLVLRSFDACVSWLSRCRSDGFGAGEAANRRGGGRAHTVQPH